MSRIDRLPPDTREVLKAGSVVGRSFSEDVLSAIDDQRLRPVSLARAFDELLGAGLVVPSEEDGPTLTFRHALVLDESVTERQRRAIFLARNDQSSTKQFVERPGQGDRPQALIVDSTQHVLTERPSYHRAGLEYLPRVGGQSVDARHQQPLYSVRDLERCLLYTSD